MTDKAENLEAQEELDTRQKTDRMGTEKIGKLLTEFSVPAIISLAFGQLYNVISAIFLGITVPTVGVAVTTLAYPLAILLHGFSVWAGQGGASFAAISMGEGKRDVVERIMGNSTFLFLACWCAIVVFTLLFIDPFLRLVGTPDTMMEPTRVYFSILLFFSGFQLLGSGLNNFLRVAGEPRIALYTTLLGTFACICFNALFVMVFRWGIPGSAMATVCGQFLTFVATLWYFVVYKNAVFKLRLSCLKPDFSLIPRILVIGFPAFALQGAWACMTVVFNTMINIYGSQDPLGVEGALAAFGASQRTVGICLTPMIGISMGAQPLAGFSYGAKNWARVRGILGRAIAASMLVGVIVCIMTHLIPHQIVGLFGLTGELGDFAAEALQIMTVVFYCVGFQIVGSSYFQSTGQAMKATVLELSRQVIFLLPLYLILPTLNDLFGVSSLTMIALCVPIADVLAALTTYVFVHLELRKFKKYLAVSEPAE